MVDNSNEIPFSFDVQSLASERSEDDVLLQIAMKITVRYRLHGFLKRMEKHGRKRKGATGFESFFNKCVADCQTEEEFESRWESLREQLNLSENSWLSSLYRSRERWACVPVKKPSLQVYNKKFESLGILSVHALKVLNARNIFHISHKYALKRWTKYGVPYEYEQEMADKTKQQTPQIGLFSPSLQVNSGIPARDGGGRGIGNSEVDTAKTSDYEESQLIRRKLWLSKKQSHA
ncbi:hypothetical protein OIU76_021245 [Salix suchowensis]|nr:hypothetical protein OIU76_021245 [Salix suchowensis]